jgi:hypothetical protein
VTALTDDKMKCISKSYIQYSRNAVSWLVSSLSVWRVLSPSPILSRSPRSYCGPFHQNFSKTIILRIDPILTVQSHSPTQDKNLPRTSPFLYTVILPVTWMFCPPLSYNLMPSIFFGGWFGGGGAFHTQTYFTSLNSHTCLIFAHIIIQHWS